MLNIPTGASDQVIYSEGSHAEEDRYESPSIQDKFSITYQMDTFIDSIEGVDLLKPIPVTICCEEEHYFVSNKDLDITEVGSTLDEALQQFKEFFTQDFQNWLEIDNRELTKKAKALKNRYLQFAAELVR